MGSTNLDDVVEGLGFLVQCIPQLCEGRDQVLSDLEDCGNVHGGGEASDKIASVKQMSGQRAESLTCRWSSGSC